MRGIAGNIIVSESFATIYKTNTRKTNSIMNQEPAHPYPRTSLLDEGQQPAAAPSNHHSSRRTIW